MIKKRQGGAMRVIIPVDEDIKFVLCVKPKKFLTHTRKSQLLWV